MAEPPPPPPAPTDPYGRQTATDVNTPGPDNPEIPAGYTYLGQFIDHDTTFDPTSRLQQVADPDALVDFRTPRLDLDSVYGSGPADQPFMYEADGLRFVIESITPSEFDIPRNAGGRALIGDPRNDVNLIVSQLHLLFCQAHNHLVDALLADGVDAAEVFEAARRELTWTYQRIVLDDYLPTIAGAAVVGDVYRRTETYKAGAASPIDVPLPDVVRRFYSWRNDPYMPVEFSGAVFRYGHSQIRPEYELNATLGPKPLFDPTSDNMLGNRRRPAGWTIDWSRFFIVAGSLPQLSRLIDTRIVEPMLALPASVATDPPSIAARNLLRGCTYQLPCGQAVARAMGIEPISADLIAGTATMDPALSKSTPLWYYVLAEAQILEAGHHLGPVGGRILCEVIAGLIDGDPNSFLNVDPNFKPRFATLSGDRVTMADLVTYVGGTATS